MEALDHLFMLQDEYRCRTYDRAIRRVVRRGDVVVDVGTGTGILALMAARAGAARVYAIERDPIALLARDIVRANGLADRIEVIRADAADVRLPRKADVLVTETVSPSLGTGEKIVELMRDVAPRLLRRGGRRIPSALLGMVVPVSDVRAIRDDRFWSDVCGFDFTAARTSFRNRCIIRRGCDGTPLGPVRRLFRIPLDGGAHTRLPVECTQTLGISRDGRLTSLRTWFRLEMAPGVRFDSMRTTSFYRAAIPIYPACAVRPGDRIRAWIFLSEAGGLTWRTEVLRRGRPALQASGSEALAPYHAGRKD